MNRTLRPGSTDAHQRLEDAYKSEKPRLLARLRAAGRTLEEAEDFVQDIYAETMKRLSFVTASAICPPGSIHCSPGA